MLAYGVLALCAYVLALRCKGRLVIRRYAVRVGLSSDSVCMAAYGVLLGAFNVRLVLLSGGLRKVVVISQWVVLVRNYINTVKLLVSLPVHGKYTQYVKLEVCHACALIFFFQEVVAVSAALKDYAPQTDVAIELGGEDAKIIYFTGGIDQRMNGICAGGTGSFIDQMAALLQTDASGLNEYAKNYQAIYPIAARSPLAAACSRRRISSR